MTGKSGLVAGVGTSSFCNHLSNTRLSQELTDAKSRGEIFIRRKRYTHTYIYIKLWIFFNAQKEHPRNITGIDLLTMIYIYIMMIYIINTDCSPATRGKLVTTEGRNWTTPWPGGHWVLPDALSGKETSLS